MSLKTLSLGGLEFSNALTAGQHLTVRTGPGDEDFVNVFLGEFRTYMTELINNRLEIVEDEVAVPKPSVWPSVRTMTLNGVVGGSVSFDGSVNFSLTTTIADNALTIAKTSGLQVALNSKLDATANAVSASKLQTGRTLALNGIISGSGVFDGSANLSIETQIADGALALSKTAGLSAALDSKASHAGQDYTGSHNFKDGRLNIWQKGAEALASLNFYSAGAVLTGRLGQSYPNGTLRLQRMNAAGNAVEGDLSIGATSATYNGHALWHAGNLDASTFNYLSVASTVYASGAGANCDTFAAGLKALVHNANTNTPGAASTFWFIETLMTGSDSNNLLQRAWGTSTDEQYFRRCSAGVWGAWRRVWNSFNFDPATKLDSNANAVSATKLLTARTIALSGIVSGSGTFDGTANLTLNTAIADGALSYAKIAGLQAALDERVIKGTTFSDAFNALPLVAPSSSNADNFAVGVRMTAHSNDASNLPGTGTFYLETVRAGASDFLIQTAISSTGEVYTRTKSTTWSSWRRVHDTTSLNLTTFNAPTATRLQTARTIALTGTITGSTSFDGSANVSMNTTVADGTLTIAKTSGLAAALDAKLDSAAYTASDILSKLKTVDGVGSGLDADLFDGQESAYFWNMGNFDPANKYDVSGGVLSGLVTFAMADANRASFNIPQTATIPTAPNNGDFWATTTGLFYRLGGITRTMAHLNSWSTVPQAEAEAGTATGQRLWTAQRVAQAIAAQAAPKVHSHNSFTGDVVMAGDFLPDLDNVRSLGSPTLMWKDVYIGPGSLYLNGQKVLEDSESGTIVMRADPGQNISIQTYTTGDVELAPQGSGMIQLKGPVVFNATSLVRSSDGSSILFDDDIEFTPGAGIKGPLRIDNNVAWHAGNFNPSSKLDATATATAATKLASARTFSLSGPVTATGVSFDGTGNVVLNTTIGEDALSISMVDGLQEALNSTSTSEHTHEISKIDGLQTELDLRELLTRSFAANHRRVRPVDAAYQNQAPSLTGAFKVTLPVSWNNTMMVLRIRGHNHNAKGHWEILVSGYNYVTDGLWHFTAASVVSGDPSFGQVRFAHDGSKCCLILGTLADTHAYPSVEVVEAHLSYNGASGIGATGWSVSHITSEEGLVFGGATRVIYATTPAGELAKLRTVDGAGSGLDADLLDGLNASVFLRNDQSGTIAGDLQVNGAVTIHSSQDGILNLRQAGVSGTAGVKNAGWNYIQFLDSEGDRQAYFGMHSNGDFVFESEITGVVKIGNNPIWHAGTFNPANKLDVTANAVSATKLVTARSIGLSGPVTATGVDFDGTGNITLTTAIADGTLSIAKTSGLSAALNAKIESSLIGVANGLTPLGADAKIPAQYLPSFVDDTIEVNTFIDLPATGEQSKIYVVLESNLIYRWTGSTYVEISSAANADASTRWTTARTITLSGKASGSVSIDGSQDVTLEVTGLSGTKADVGLANVDNTSDMNKPVSTATATALGLKLDSSAYTASDVLAKLLTVDGAASNLDADLLDGQHGSYYLSLTNATGTLAAARLPAFTGDVTTSAGSSATTIANNAVTFAKIQQINTGLVLGRTSAGTGNVEVLTGAQVKGLLGLVAADVGLGQVDNTSDANKPVSTATQSALNLKLDASTYTASDVIAKLLTVDGAGSGLDADTLDGLDSNSFFRRDTANSYNVRFSPTSGYGVRFWDSDLFKIFMTGSGDATWGGRVAGETTSDYNMHFRMSQATNRGFIFETDRNNKLFGIHPDKVRSLVAVQAPTFEGALTGNVTGNLTGNADSATKLQSARTFSLTGLVTATGVSFDGTGNLALNTAIADNALSIAKTNGLSAALAAKIESSLIGVANGITPLGSDAKIPAQYLPSFVDDTMEAADYASLPTVGEASKIYVTLDNNKIYRWSGTVYVEISSAAQADSALRWTTARTLTLSGKVSGSVLIDGSSDVTLNVTTLAGTKADVGLGNVDNTSDANKPVSTATQTALNLKLNSSAYTAADVLAKLITVDGASSGLDADLLDGQEGSYYRNLANATGTLPVAALPAYTGDVTSGVGTSVNTISPNAVTFGKFQQVGTSTILGRATAGTGNVETLTGSQVKTILALVKADVGLENVDNTSDLNKPVSNATQTALNLKLNSSSYTAADVLAKLITVDGAGSGLDADTLDGINSSSFVRNDVASPTFGAGVTGADNVLNINNPGIGYLSGFRMGRTSDHAGIAVLEYANDQTLYEMWMSDNPDSTVDIFSWRINDWQSINGTWQPMQMSGMETRFINTNTRVFGNLVQGTDAFFTTGDPVKTDNTRFITHVGHLSKLKMAGSGSVTITGFNVSGYTGTNGRVFWIRLTSPTTFEWGYNSHTTSPITQETDMPVTTTGTLLSNGVRVSFSSTSAGVAGDLFGCRLYRKATATFSDTSIAGNLDVVGASTFTGAASVSGDLSVGGNTTFTGRIMLNQPNGGLRFGTFDVLNKFYVHGRDGSGDDIFEITRNGTSNYTVRTRGTLEVSNNVVWHAGNDGAGSGLDADLLDGQNGSWYQSLANSTGTLPTTALPAYTGDVTSPAGSSVNTIANNAVTFAKIQQVATATLMGRSSTGTGNLEALTVSQAKTLMGLNNVDNTSDANKPISTATQSALDLKVNAILIGSANGIAPLGADSKIPTQYLPSYVDDVLEFADQASFPATGETGKIYLALDSNKIYRWTGSTYISVSDAASTADVATRWATARTLTLSGKVGGSVSFDGSADFTLNVTSLNGTKADVGLANVDNTSDLNKPVSTATQSALDLKLNASAYTAADILAKLLTVDGTGSGLDADTLDGHTSGSFWRSDTGNSADVRVASGNGRGLRFWDSDSYKIQMSHSSDASWGGRITGEVQSDYNLYFRMGQSTGVNRGFVFETDRNTKLFAINPDRVRSSAPVQAPSFLGDLTGNVTGNLSGNVTGNVTGALTGNASSATKLETARSFSLAGVIAANGVSFDGTGNVELTTTIADNALSIAKVSGLAAALNAKIESSLIGVANGLTPLGADAKIPAQYLPSFVDDAMEYANFASLPTTGEAGKIYVTIDTNLIYRWSGSTYIEISSAATADTSTRWSTARQLTLAGKVSGSVMIDGSQDVTLNVTGLSGTKADVGLGNVDNTSDANKPISTATQTALNGKITLMAQGSTTDVNAILDTRLHVGSTNGWLNRPPSGNNAGALFSIATHPSSGTDYYNSQLWFDTAGDDFWYRTRNGTSVRSWSKVWTSKHFDPANKLDVSAYTAADVLTKIKTVDGSTSGLDADLLDGQEGSWYQSLANATGTLADARLSTNVPLKGSMNTFTNANTWQSGATQAFTFHSLGDGFSGGVTLLLKNDSIETNNTYLRLQTDANGTPINFADFRYNGANGLNIVTAGLVQINGNTAWHSGNLDPTLYAPIASPSFTGNATVAGRLTSHGANFSNDIRFTPEEAYPNGYGQIRRSSGAGGLALRGYMHETFPAYVDIDPIPVDGTSAAIVRIMRTTNTTGSRSIIVHNGDGTSGKMFELSNTLLQYQGNNIWHAGNFNPSSKLDATATAVAATTLATSRDFSITGPITASAVGFNGSGNVVLNSAIADGALSIAMVAGLQSGLDSKANAALLGVANGIATLGSDGKVLSSQLPSYVDDVVEVDNHAALPTTGETGKIYLTLDNNKIYRWTGSTYISISDAVSASDTALKWATPRTLTLSGKAAGSVTFDGSADFTLDVTSLSVSKADVGLGNVDNTSDLNKPVSTATQTALNLKLNSTAYTAADVLTKVLTVDGAGSGLDADLLDGVDGSNYVRGDLTYLGRTGGQGSDNTTNTAAAWSALPVGYARFMKGSEITTAGGTPVSNWGYFFKLGARDMSGGWSGIWTGYSTGQHYIGRSSDSSTLPTWEKIWTDANDGAGSTLDSDLLDGQHGSFYQNAGNLNAGTLLDVRLSTNVPLKSALNVFTETQRISAGSSTANKDFVQLTPSDHGAGKPGLFLKKETQADRWTIGLWDLTSQAGTIDIGANSFTKQGQTVWHAGNDGAGSGLDADLLDGQNGSWYQDLSNATGTLATARLPANVMLNTLAALGPDGQTTANFWTDGAGAQIKVYNNTTGSTGFPGEFGATWSFRSTTGDNSGTYARAFDVHRRNSNNELLIRTYANTGLPNNWQRLWSESNDGAGSGLDADLLDGQQGSWYQDLANTTGTLADARLTTNVALKSIDNFFSVGQTIRVGAAATVAEYLRFSPTDQGAGKPALVVTKSATADRWNIALWDGTGNAGTLDLSADTLTKQGQTIWHAGNFNPNTKANLNAPNFTGVVGFLGRVEWRNPNNIAAEFAIDWTNDAPRLRVGGSGTGAGATFSIQGVGDFVRMSVDSAGNGTFAGTSLTVGGNAVWHAGNFNPATKLDSSSYTSGDVLAKLLTVDGVGSALDADLLDGQHGSFYQNASNLNAGTVADARLTSNVALKNNANSFTTTQYIQASTATTATDYLSLNPTDYGTGKPRLLFKKEATADLWSVGLWDGTNQSGRIDFSVNNLTKQGQVIWHAGNDGAGSTLDADLLDGQQGAWYQDMANATGTLADARLSTNVSLLNVSSTFTGSQTFDGNLTRFTHGATDLRIEVSNADASAPRIQSYGNKPLYLNELGNQVIIGGSGLIINGNTAWHGGNFQPSSKLDVSAYTAADVLTKVKSVDGSGSGLDADLLDGQEGSHYLSLNNMTGVLPASKGGTGIAEVPAGSYVRGTGTDALEARTPAQVRKDIGATTFTMSELPPENPNEGDEWVKKSTGVKYTWFVDEDSAQWVNLSSGSAPASGSSGLQTYIQPQQPVSDQPFVWFQTGLGEDGKGLTMWINIPD